MYSQQDPIKTVHFEILCFSANVDQFLKFFYQVIRRKMFYVCITKISTSPAIGCCTTLWKLKIQKCFLQGGPIKTVHFEILCFSANVDQFLKFFCQVIRRKMFCVCITKISTSPAIGCCTTLWKLKIQKCYWLWQHLNRLLTCSWGHFEDLMYDVTFNSS